MGEENLGEKEAGEGGRGKIGRNKVNMGVWGEVEDEAIPPKVFSSKNWGR